jgi:hypothetical protein
MPYDRSERPLKGVNQVHGRRVGYYVVGEDIILDPPALFGGLGQPPAAASASVAPPKVSSLKFGRMFGKAGDLPPADGKALFDKLITLGLCMNDPVTYCQQPVQVDIDKSDTPSGYTYLGQFIAHEITFDSTGDMLEAGMQPQNLRTPQIDLDSLYGGANGPADRPELYEPDRAHLKVGRTYYVTPPGDTFPQDLPRDTANPDNPKKALIGDERNDENLALAQTHVAFIHFHNKVVDKLIAGGHDADGLFECARRQVIRHFQWIILNDYLPRLVDKDVLDCVRHHGLRWFKVEGEDGLFMPLEFSAAAFRIGHSMVRRNYEWNRYHCSDPNSRGAINIIELFQQTAFSQSPGSFGGSPMLQSDWIIDWRRFYDFDPLKHVPPVSKLNKSSKLDTVLNFRLDRVVGFPDTKLEKMQKAIAVRNLLRGFYLGLPTGEEVAEWIGETPLKHEEVADGPHRQLLADPDFQGKTPLWYYVLKEAELNGGSKLGRVGSRIVAETLIGLIKKSPYSILDDPGWRPKFGRPAQGAEPEHFEMIDLLDFAGVVDPLG